jgi:hypothetical protein
MRPHIMSALAGLSWVSCPAWAAPQPDTQSVARAAISVEGAATPTLPATKELSVVYENGQLSIDARNVPYGDVVFEVCGRIGAWFDAPFGSEEPLIDQPVAVHLGPGPARVVLVALLKTSPLAFGITGLPNDPDALAQVSVYAKRARAAHEINQQLASSAAPGSADAPPPQVVAMQVSGLIAQARAELAATGDNAADGGMLHALESAVSDAAAAEATQHNAAVQASPPDPDGIDSPPTRQLIRARRR